MKGRAPVDIMRSLRLWLIALFFAGCPWEMQCVNTEPRPSPATLSEVNEELVSGLERCGYVGPGRRGAITLVRVESGAGDEAMGCVRACIHDLRDDCEALVEMACAGAVPDELTRCSWRCEGGMCQRHAGSHSDCGGPMLRCGVGLEGMAPLFTGERPRRAFECADGSGAIAMMHVCDFVEDCPDGSDEDERLRCARLSCADADEERGE